MRSVVPRAYYQSVTQGVEPVDLLRLIGSAAQDYDSMDELEQVLLPADGLHPLAAQLVAPILAFAADPKTRLPDQLLMLVRELAAHPDGEPVHQQLRAFTVTLRSLSDLDDHSVVEESTALLGWCGPDPQLSAVLLARAREYADDYRRVTPLVTAAQLDPAAAAGWLPEFLDPSRSSTVRVAAVLAMREAGLAPTASAATALAAGWSADPDALRWTTRRGRLADLVEYAAGGDPGRDAELLTTIARDGQAQARRDVAQTLADRAAAQRLPVALQALLCSFLDDPEERVRRCAYRAVVADDTLTRRQADWLADAVARGARMRRSALDALIRVGDPRWRAHAEDALRQGWTPPRLPGALAELPPPDGSLREAVLGRVVALATTIDVNRSPKATAKEQRELVGLLRVLGAAADPAVVGTLARHLAQMTWPARLWVAEFLAEAGRGNPEVLDAIGAMANGEVIYLRLLWLAGGDDAPLRAAIAVAPRRDVLAAVAAAEVFGDADPDVAARLREIRDSDADLKDRFAAAGALWELTGDPAEAAATVREALDAPWLRTRQRARELADQLGLEHA
ncbi:hypothetical protein Cci01nite_07430 [Catellatospora citrea]|uniref:Uncharacterized protein n=1 Tax=Catellatospora citrea TaxID=53366 RepID=A0A8J3KID6_9ACTN|nr:hypothetical protein C8E86_2320 [Catellatospora citrea]GIF95649.1 hypothetical protein Cci01nite_07430 [Catellatospora citrea]